MMTLRGFCLVLTTVLLAHFAQQGSASEQRASVQFVIGYCVAFSLLGKLCAVGATLRLPASTPARVWQRFESQRTLVEWLWVGSLPWAMAASGWVGSLAHLYSQNWPHWLLLMVWFAPSLAFLFALDLSAAQLEHYLTGHFRGHSSAGRSGRLVKTNATSVDAARPGLLRLWTERVRLGGTGAVIMCLVPVLAVVGCIDGLDRWAAAASPSVRGLAAVLILGVVCLTLSPVWMRAWIGARPFGNDSPVPARVADFCRELRVRAPSVLCISGSQAWHGAALVGWVPPARQLWLGAAVVRDLPAEELDMVILHELAHLRRGHAWWRIAALLVCGACILWAITSGWIGWSGAGAGAAQWQQWLERAALLALGGMILMALSWTSRWCELDADSDACRQASRLCRWAGDRPDRAAAALVSALMRMHGEDADLRRLYWLHPSLAERRRALLARYRFDASC